MEENKIIAENLTAFRKNAGLTQLELAEKINYSDKAVSKWERGESFPDIFVFKRLAALYNTSIDNILKDNSSSKLKYLPSANRRKVLVAMLAVGLVWLAFLTAFTVVALITENPGEFGMYLFWALPASGVIMIIFSAVYKSTNVIYVCISFFIWMLALCLFLTFLAVYSYLLFVIAGVIQILIILWYLWARRA